MRTKDLTEHLESPSKTAALPRGVPRRRASSCPSDDSLTLENKGSESKPCAGDVAFTRALAALASQRRHTERQVHPRTRIVNKSDAIGASLSGERKSDQIGENEDSHSEIHLISMAQSVDSELNSTGLEGTDQFLDEEYGPQENNESLSVNDLGIYIVDVVVKNCPEDESAISEDLLEEGHSKSSSSAEYSSDDECSGVEDLSDAVGALSSFESDADVLDDVDAKRKPQNGMSSLLRLCIAVIMTSSIAVLAVVIISGPRDDHQSTLRGTAVDQSQSLADKTHQPPQQQVGVQARSKSPTTRPSDIGLMSPTSIQNIFDDIKSTTSAPTPSLALVLDDVAADFYLSSTLATPPTKPSPDTLYLMADKASDELEEGPQFEKVVNVLTKVLDPIESITGCADTGTQSYLFDNIITEFMCPPPPETRSSDPTFVFNIGPSFIEGIRVFAATQCESCDPISYRLEGSNDEGKTFFLISEGPFDSDWIDQEMPPRRNSKFASTLGGLDRLSFGYVNFDNFAGFVPVQYSQYRLAFTQMRGFDTLMWLGELQLFGSLQIL